MEETAPASGELLGEEEAAEEPAAPEHSVVLVHVKQRCIAVSCGGGGQTVGWLANVGVVRHDASLGRALGPAAGVRLGSGQMVPLHFTLAEAGIRDGQHVWVVLKGRGERRARVGSAAFERSLCVPVAQGKGALRREAAGEGAVRDSRAADARAGADASFRRHSRARLSPRATVAVSHEDAAGRAREHRMLLSKEQCPDGRIWQREAARLMRRGRLLLRMKQHSQRHRGDAERALPVPVTT